ncbi:MAG: amidohydrolase [Pirellulales bacterium]|nr:amidohydrolase [Pirellulales bacterium]
MNAARDEPTGWIDAHSHVWTPDTEGYPLTAGFRRDEMKPPSFTADDLLALAEPAGVSRVVLIQMSFYGFDNRYVLDCRRQRPTTFSVVAVIDDAARHSPDELRELRAAGVRGIRIYPRNRPVDRWLDGDTMSALWKWGAADRVAMCCLVNPGDLPAIDSMCATHVETPVVIDHFARIGVDGQLREVEINQLCRLARHPNTYVKVSAFYALGRKEPPYLDLAPMIRRLYDAFGPRRLMWGTDCPYQVVTQKYGDSVALVAERLDFLSAADRQEILRGTAERVFFA